MSEKEQVEMCRCRLCNKFFDTVRIRHPKFYKSFKTKHFAYKVGQFIDELCADCWMDYHERNDYK